MIWREHRTGKFSFDPGEEVSGISDSDSEVGERSEVSGGLSRSEMENVRRSL